jgi:chloride channel 3/4/5
MRSIHSRKGTRYRLLAMFDDATGWFVAALVGTLTACVAYLVDVAEATVSDWKLGYCKRNPLLNFDSCCETTSSPSLAKTYSPITITDESTCEAFHKWSSSYTPSFAIYVAFALAFGIISSSATMLTKRSLPAASPGTGDKDQYNGPPAPVATGKTMYMAAGSGIPEIKTILSGFVIPNFLDFKVLFVKGFGAVFAVATGMCLGKEGPFVHISTCVGYLVAKRFAKYRDNGRKMREMLSVACAAGLSVGMLCFRLFEQRSTSPILFWLD